MLLPPALFAEIAPHIPEHDRWHTARRPMETVLRRTMRGECEAQLKALDEPGSGCDFLRFHRRMMRHFAWAIDQHPEIKPAFTFEPWIPTLPPWVEQLLRDVQFNLDAAYRGIDNCVSGNSVDMLGGYIEPNSLWNNNPGAGIHAAIHEVVGKFEFAHYSGDLVAPMGDLGHSPGNIFFWTLHAWIDERFADWQRRNGEVVDQSPMRMDMDMAKKALLSDTKSVDEGDTAAPHGM